MKKKSKVTLKDVAKHAGVSVTAVSNVIRNWPYISDELYEKVNQAIRELGYVPNPIAQGLRTGRTQAIGFIIPDLTNPFQGTIVSTVEDIAKEHGFSVLVSNTHENEAREHDSILQMVSRNVDGLIIIHAPGTHFNAALISSLDIPLVLLDRVPPDFAGAYCRIDSNMVVQLALEHLYQLGHRRIAHLAGPRYTITAVERQHAYQQMIEQFGLAYQLIIENEVNSWKAEAGYHAMQTLFNVASDELPTAIFAANDPLAIGASHAIRQRGMRIPEDFSLVGVDDIDVSEYINPPLTSVQQPIEEAAGEAIQILLKLIESDEPERMQITLPPKLIVRDSTAALHTG